MPGPKPAAGAGAVVALFAAGAVATTGAAAAGAGAAASPPGEAASGRGSAPGTAESGAGVPAVVFAAVASPVVTCCSCRALTAHPARTQHGNMSV